MMMAGHYFSYGSQLKIQSDGKPFVVYCGRHKDVIGMPPEAWLPRPFQSAFARAVNGRWMVNRFRLEAGGVPLHLSAPEGSRFASLTLGSGDEAFLSISKLVAWTKGIHFRTRITFQLAAMSLARMFFVSARGPGTLWFEIKGPPEVRETKENDKETIDFSRVVAWDREVDFEIVGSSRMLDIYLSPLHVRPITTGTLLIDADDKSTRSGGLFTQLFSRIYLPQ